MSARMSILAFVSSDEARMKKISADHYIFYIKELRPDRANDGKSEVHFRRDKVNKKWLVTWKNLRMLGPGAAQLIKAAVAKGMPPSSPAPRKPKSSKKPETNATGYDLPSFLKRKVTAEAYARWLQRRAQAHVRRDRGRGNTVPTVSSYKRAIHEAVLACQGRDAYTGQSLDWSLISKYDNKLSEQHGRDYKKSLAALPTVDHVDEGRGQPRLVISSWRTNDAKHDLTLEEFLTLCAAVLKHHGYTVVKR